MPRRARRSSCGSPRCRASCRSAPSRRSGSCPGAAGSPGTAGRGPASRSRRPIALDDVDLAQRGSRSWQSASLPGRLLLSSAPLRRTRSRALRAASRARAASTAFATIRFATVGFSSRNAPSLSLTMASTMPLTSLLPSFVLVWPSNCGCGILTLMTAGQPLADVVAADASPSDPWRDCSSSRRR